jgi:hypothetical protein
VLKAPTPSADSASTTGQARSRGRRSRRRWRHAKGSTSAAATVQRQKASATGGTSPATARPSTAFPAQNRPGSIIKSHVRSAMPPSRPGGVMASAIP